MRRFINYMHGEGGSAEWVHTNLIWPRPPEGAGEGAVRSMYDANPRGMHLGGIAYGGNEDFGGSISMQRWVNAGDLVTTLPGCMMGFEHAGTGAIFFSGEVGDHTGEMWHEHQDFADTDAFMEDHPVWRALVPNIAQALLRTNGRDGPSFQYHMIWNYYRNIYDQNQWCKEMQVRAVWIGVGLRQP